MGKGTQWGPLAHEPTGRVQYPKARPIRPSCATYSHPKATADATFASQQQSQK